MQTEMVRTVHRTTFEFDVELDVFVLSWPPFVKKSPVFVFMIFTAVSAVVYWMSLHSKSI